MGRPKKPRFADGVQLEEHLHTDSKGRPGFWRYLRPDGTWKGFRAETVTEANRLAAEANASRDRIPISDRTAVNRAALAYHVEKYITRRERLDPKLPALKNWRNRRGALRGFARTFAATPVHKITRTQIAIWWDTLTHHQQGLRHTELRRFFNELAGEGMTPQLDYNPFTTADDRPRLYRSAKPQVARARLTASGFWQIYAKAGEIDMPGLQIAMGISLMTTMRRADICALRLDAHVKGELLQRIIGKSAAQRGDTHAVRLEWDLTTDATLAALVRRARELSLKNFRCPFLISHAPKKRRLGKREHRYQVTEDRLTKLFAEARDATGLFAELPAGQTPPTFHEIRALSSAMFGRQGYDLQAIKGLMAHTDEAVTQLYQSGQELPYVRVTMTLSPEILGGTF